MKKIALAVAITATMLATGCATKQQTGALVGAVVGTAVLGPVGGTAAAHVGMGAIGLFAGAVIGGAIGKNMDEADHLRAKHAVNSNTSTTWTNDKSGTTYTVSPKDNGDGTSTVRTDMTKSGKTTTETSTVKRIKE